MSLFQIFKNIQHKCRRREVRLPWPHTPNKVSLRIFKRCLFSNIRIFKLSIFQILKNIQHKCLGRWDYLDHTHRTRLEYSKCVSFKYSNWVSFKYSKIFKLRLFQIFKKINTGTAGGETTLTTHTQLGQLKNIQNLSLSLLFLKVCNMNFRLLPNVVFDNISWGLLVKTI